MHRSSFKRRQTMNPWRVNESACPTVRMSSKVIGWHSWCIRIWFLFLATVFTTTTTQAQLRIPFMGTKTRKSQQHTPLLFLTVPPGIIPECDAMEAVVRQIERENPDIRVQRLDILRHPENEALLHVLAASSSSSGSSTLSATPPLLYHRESCQTIQIKPSTASSGKSKKEESTKTKPAIYIDKARVRAWAKGRIWTQAATTTMGGSPVVSRNAISQNQQSPITTTTSSSSEDTDATMDSEAFEMLEDLALTETQRKGKRLIQERTEQQALKQTSK